MNSFRNLEILLRDTCVYFDRQSSAVEMQGLADMFEGWAQSDRTDCVNVARLHGWSDSFRSLVEVVGIDYVPSEAPPGAPVSLMKFMALKMGS